MQLGMCISLDRITDCSHKPTIVCLHFKDSCCFGVGFLCVFGFFCFCFPLDKIVAYKGQGVGRGVVFLIIIIFLYLYEKC